VIDLQTLIPWVGLPIGLALLLWGWRGRRVGAFPTCRRCGYNLTGLDERPRRCPECGANLQRPGAVARGGRRRRRGGLIAGLVVTVIACVPIAITLTDFDYYALAPDRVLVWLIEDPDAEAEVNRRLTAGAFDPHLASQLIDARLDLQADPTVAWDAAWGATIDAAGAGGMLSPAQAERYA